MGKGVLAKLTVILGMKDDAFSHGVESAKRSVRNLALGMVAAGAIILTALSGATMAAVGFDAAMRNVNSIAGLSESALGALNDEVLALAASSGQMPVTLANGLYDIVSSGFAAADAMTILDAAATAATAGLTTTEVSGKAITAVLNAYGLEAEQAAAVSNVLFQTVDSGVLTFEELANNLGNTLSLASSLGVGIEELGASYALLTRSGVSASLAETQIAGLLKAAINPTEALTAAVQGHGFASVEAMLATEGYSGFLAFLAKESAGSKEALFALLGTQEAVNAALILGTDGGEAYAAMLLEMSGAQADGGATARVLAEQQKSAAFQMQKLRAQIQVLAIRIGSVFLPALTFVVGKLSDLVMWFNELPEPLKRFLAIAAAVSGSMLFLGGGAILLGMRLRAAFGTILAGVNALTGLKLSALGLLGPLGLVTVAGAGLAVAWQTDFLGLRSALEPIFDRVGGKLRTFADEVAGFYEGARLAGKTPVEAAFIAFGNALDRLLGTDTRGFFSDLGTGLSVAWVLGALAAGVLADGILPPLKLMVALAVPVIFDAMGTFLTIVFVLGRAAWVLLSDIYAVLALIAGVDTTTLVVLSIALLGLGLVILGVGLALGIALLPLLLVTIAVLLLVGALALLYLAYRNNFMGFGDLVDREVLRAKLAFDGLWMLLLAFVAWFGGQLREIKGLVAGVKLVWVEAFQFMAESVNTVVGAVEALQAAVDLLDLGKLFSQGPSGEGFWEGVASGIASGAGTPFGGIVSGAQEMFGAESASAAEAGGGGGAAVTAALAQPFSDALTQITTTMGEIKTTIGTAWSDVVTDSAAKTLQLHDDALANLDLLKTDSAATWADLVTNATNESADMDALVVMNFAEMHRLSAATMTNMAIGVGGAFTQMADQGIAETARLDGAVSGIFAAMAERAYGAGVAIGGGLGSGIYWGIDQWVGAIADKAAEAVNAAINSANAAADPGSPSKPMLYIGNMMALGLLQPLRAAERELGGWLDGVIPAPSSPRLSPRLAGMGGGGRGDVNLTLDMRGSLFGKDAEKEIARMAAEHNTPAIVAALRDQKRRQGEQGRPTRPIVRSE